MSEIKQEYGKFIITYNEERAEWIGNLGDTIVARSAKLSELRKRLDNHEESEKKFVRIPVFCWQWQKWIEGIVTSVSNDGDVWVSWADKTRSKAYLTTDLYLVIPENIRKRDEWDRLQVDIDRLKESQEDILKAMKKFKKAKP
jgi:hypothetical protein